MVKELFGRTYVSGAGFALFGLDPSGSSVAELSDDMTADDLPSHFRVRGGNEGASDASEFPLLKEDSSSSSSAASPISSSSSAAPPVSSFPEEAREVLGFWGSWMEIP